MRNTLQYAYSISVFIGVLITAYFMMNKESSARLPLRSVQAPAYRMESTVDPAVNQLFQVEGALSEIKRQQQNLNDAKRLPTESQK